MNKDKSLIWISIALFIVILFADRISKHFVFHNLQDKSIHIMPFVDLVFVSNKGIVFGLFSGSNFNFLVLSILSVVFIAFILIVWFKPIPYPVIAMVLAGGIGNMIDRIQYGFVVDFIKVDRFYVFNIADASISISIVLFLWFFLFKKHEPSSV